MNERYIRGSTAGRPLPNSKHLVLRFGKALTQDPARLAAERHPLWITLGYFDTLQIYPLPMTGSDDSWIRATCLEDRKISSLLDGNFYFHPVHIVTCEDDKRQQSHERFCSLAAPYLAVTFVQELSVEGPPDIPLDQVIQEALEGPIGAKDVTLACYHTLNLSDIVILWKADTLGAIFRAIQLLYRLPRVGDLHTIPAILFSSLLEESSAPKTRAEQIPLVLTRYLVRNTHSADKYFKAISPHLAEAPFLTTGMEDLSTVAQNVDVNCLLGSLRARLTDQAVQTAFQDAFLESEIHLGTPESGQTKEFRENLRLKEFCQTLQTRFNKVRCKLEKEAGTDTIDGDWLKVAGELYNALLDMSRSTVSDGFCYLILESAELFCRELESLPPPDSDQTMRIHRFLRGWGTLMEQSMRQDGKFSQQPGFSPALCQIPSSLLELYLAFNAQCCRVICYLASDDSKFCFLLVPKLCRRIKVDTVILKSPPCNRLLYVDIPSDLLYEPSLVLPHLCHELSHFCGENWRLRKIRKEKYLHICAGELAYSLNLYQQTVEEFLYDKLIQKEYSNPAYLELLESEAFHRVEEMLQNDSLIEELLKCANKGEDKLSSYEQYIKTIANICDLRNSFQKFESKPKGAFFYGMEEFRVLFQECYADVSMIFTLKLSCRQYLCLNRKEEGLARRAQGKKSDSSLLDEETDYSLTVERWAVVLQAMFPDEALKTLESETDQRVKPFADAIRLCIVYLSNYQELPPKSLELAMYSFHRQESLKYLGQYLSSCKLEMEKSDTPENDDLRDLRTIFASIAQDNDLFSDSCRQLVQKYRGALLKGK